MVALPLQSAALLAPVAWVTPDCPAMVGQAVHCSCPASDWYEPAGQGLQESLATSRKVPTAQATEINRISYKKTFTFKVLLLDNSKKHLKNNDNTAKIWVQISLVIDIYYGVWSWKNVFFHVFEWLESVLNSDDQKQLFHRFKVKFVTLVWCETL